MVPGPQIQQGHFPVQKRQEKGGGAFIALALKVNDDVAMPRRRLCHFSPRISATARFDGLHLDNESLLKLT